MRRFPYSSSYPLHSFSLTLPDGSRVEEGALERLHSYVSRVADEAGNGRLLRSRVPASLTFGSEELWGWFWLDGQGPITVGPWIAVGMRQWTKKPPPKILAAIVEERCEAWCRENRKGRAPRRLRFDLRKRVEAELVVAQPPDLREFAILIDVVRMQVLLPGLAQSQVKAVTKRLDPLLRHVVHRDARLTERGLDDYLIDSRPQAMIPNDIGDQWLAFLVERAAAGTWAVFRGVPEHDEPVVFKLAIDGRVSLATGDDDFVNADGDAACRDILRWVGDEAMVRVRTATILLTEPEPGRRYALRLENTGAIEGVRFIGAPGWSQGEPERVVDAVFERAEELSEAALYVRLLMHAFDAGPLELMMTEGRQMQFWPGRVEPRVEWYDSMPTPGQLGISAPPPGSPTERDRRRARARGNVEGLADRVSVDRNLALQWALLVEAGRRDEAIADYASAFDVDNDVAASRIDGIVASDDFQPPLRADVASFLLSKKGAPFKTVARYRRAALAEKLSDGEITPRRIAVVVGKLGRELQADA